MPVLDQVVVVLSANTEEFVAKMQGAKTEMTSLGKKATAEGEVAGAGLSTGIGSGSKKAERDIEEVGATFDRTNRHIERSSEGLGLFGRALGGIGGPLGDAQKKTASYRSELNNVGQSGGMLGNIFNSLGGGWMSVIAGLGGTAAVLVNLGLNAQDVGTKIANTANITVDAGNKIVAAMQTTAGKTTFNGNQLASAYANVAGALGLMNGAALSAKDSVTFMLHSSDLAEASGTSLTSATKALSDILVTYHIDAKNAGNATDILYNSSRLTGQSIPSLASSFQRLHSQLGIVTPPLAQTAGLMLDLNAHGLTGRSAIASLSSAYNHLLQPQSAVQVALIKQRDAMKGMTPAMLDLYKRYNDGTISTKDYKKALGALDTTQQTTFATYKQAEKHLQAVTANLGAVGIRLTDAKGNFVGMNSVIAQTDQKLKGHTQAQQLAIAQMIFGSGVNRKFLATILAGPDAYKKYTDEVQNSAHAHAAAERATGTMRGQIEKIKTSMHDFGTLLGTKIMPYVVKFAGKLADVANWISEHWPKIMKVLHDGVKFIKPGFHALGEAIKFLKPAFKTMGEAIAKAFQWLIKHKPVLIAVLAAIGIAIAYVFFPITGIVIGVIALVALLIKAWGPVKNFFIKIWEAIYKFFKPIIPLLKAGMDMIIGNLKIGWSVIETVFKIAWDAIMMVVRIAWAIISGFIKVVIAIFSGNWSAAWNAVKNTFIAVWNAIKDFVLQVWNAIKDFFVGAFNSFVSMFKGVWNGTRDWLKGVWKEIKKLAEDGWNAVLGFFKDAGTWLWKVGKKIITGLWNGMKHVWTDVKNWFNDVLGWLGLGGSSKTATINVNGQNISRTSGLGSFGGSPNGVGIAPKTTPHSSTVLHVTTPIQVDGRTIATSVTQYQLQNARSTGTALGRYAGGTQTATSTGTSTLSIPR